YAPADLAGSGAAEDPAAGERLTFAAFGASPDDPAGVMVITAMVDGKTWESKLAFQDFVSFFADIRDGYSASLAVDGEVVEVASGVDEINLPLGPLIARGSLDEWQSIVDRECTELAPLEECPVTSTGASWTGERTIFPVL